jgi:hypothetical protein
LTPLNPRNLPKKRKAKEEKRGREKISNFKKKKKTL